MWTELNIFSIRLRSINLKSLLAFQLLYPLKISLCSPFLTKAETVDVAGASSSDANSSGKSSNFKTSIAAAFLILCLLYFGIQPRLSMYLVFSVLSNLL